MMASYSKATVIASFKAQRNIQDKSDDEVLSMVLSEFPDLKRQIVDYQEPVIQASEQSLDTAMTTATPSRPIAPPTPQPEQTTDINQELNKGLIHSPSAIATTATPTGPATELESEYIEKQKTRFEDERAMLIEYTKTLPEGPKKLALEFAVSSPLSKAITALSLTYALPSQLVLTALDEGTSLLTGKGSKGFWDAVGKVANIGDRSVGSVDAMYNVLGEPDSEIYKYGMRALGFMFDVALSHKVDDLGARGAVTAGRKLATSAEKGLAKRAGMELVDFKAFKNNQAEFIDELGKVYNKVVTSDVSYADEVQEMIEVVKKMDLTDYNNLIDQLTEVHKSNISSLGKVKGNLIKEGQEAATKKIESVKGTVGENISKKQSNLFAETEYGSRPVGREAGIVEKVKGFQKKAIGTADDVLGDIKKIDIEPENIHLSRENLKSLDKDKYEYLVESGIIDADRKYLHNSPIVKEVKDYFLKELNYKGVGEGTPKISQDNINRFFNVFENYAVNNIEDMVNLRGRIGDVKNLTKPGEVDHVIGRVKKIIDEHILNNLPDGELKDAFSANLAYKKDATQISKALLKGETPEKTADIISKIPVDDIKLIKKKVQQGDVLYKQLYDDLRNNFVDELFSSSLDNGVVAWNKVAKKLSDDVYLASKEFLKPSEIVQIKQLAKRQKVWDDILKMKPDVKAIERSDGVKAIDASVASAEKNIPVAKQAAESLFKIKKQLKNAGMDDKELDWLSKNISQSYGGIFKAGAKIEDFIATTNALEALDVISKGKHGFKRKWLEAWKLKYFRIAPEIEKGKKVQYGVKPGTYPLDPFEASLAVIGMTGKKGPGAIAAVATHPINRFLSAVSGTNPKYAAYLSSTLDKSLPYAGPIINRTILGGSGDDAVNEEN
jgi:hypothetical protein